MRFLLGILIFLTAASGCVRADKDTKPVALLPEISMGAMNAPVVIVEYSSLTCNHCANFHKTVMPVLTKKYILPGHVRFILRDFPGDRIALVAHQTAWCKGKDKYLDFIKLFYATQDQWLLADDPIKVLKAIALKHGITAEQFKACSRDTELMDKIIQRRLKAQKYYKITATPTLIIDATSKNPKVYQKALSLKEIEAVLRPLLNPTLKAENLPADKVKKKEADALPKKDKGKK